MSLFDRLVRLSLPLVPRRVVWQVARRYVAGETLEEGLAAVDGYEAEGFGTILDVLGEAVPSEAGARAAAAQYERALQALGDRESGTYVSAKPTHLGLSVDLGLCEELLDGLCASAAAVGRRVRFEMEDHPTVDATLDVFEAVRARCDNLGCVLQARLFRTRADVDRLLAGGPGLDVRLVKGIYLEPPEIAWTEADHISGSFVELADALVSGGAQVAFATHDDVLADACARIVQRAGLDTGPAEARSYEYQLLMGVRRNLAERLKADGHRVRVYVPYGADWHAYSMRRLAHNPQLARHVMRAMFRGDS